MDDDRTRSRPDRRAEPVAGAAALPLLREAAPKIADELAGIAAPGIAVVALGYGAEALERDPRGFGAFIQRGEGFRILGVLWDTHLFPGRSPQGALLARAMIGGAVDPNALSLPDAELAPIARDDLRRLHGLRDEPRVLELVRWPHAIPRYELGHARRVAAIEAELAALARLRPGLHLAGNYLYGIAFGKAAACGWEAGERAARELLHRG